MIIDFIEPSTLDLIQATGILVWLIPHKNHSLLVNTCIQYMPWKIISYIYTSSHMVWLFSIINIMQMYYIVSCMPDIIIIYDCIIIQYIHNILYNITDVKTVFNLLIEL